MDAEVNRRIHTVLAEAVPVDLAVLLRLRPVCRSPRSTRRSRAVRDASTRGEVVIVGRPQMINQIADFDGLRQRDPWRRSGRRASSASTVAPTIVTLKNYKDEDGQPFLPATRCGSCRRTPASSPSSAASSPRSSSEQDNWYWHYLARRDSGVLVHHPERAHLLVDSSLPAK